jgi:hypothetical protein
MKKKSITLETCSVQKFGHGHDTEKCKDVWIFADISIIWPSNPPSMFCPKKLAQKGAQFELVMF